VFLQALEKRGPDKLGKKIYMSAVTPDLYRPMYADKVMMFFDHLLNNRNAGKPLMRPYLEGYFDLYWSSSAYKASAFWPGLLILPYGVSGSSDASSGRRPRSSFTRHRGGLTVRSVCRERAACASRCFDPGIQPQLATRRQDGHLPVP
jgi:hypothetical protein